MSANDYEMRVLSGLHKDAIQPFSERSISIGSSLEADITLTDEDIAPVHARVSFASKAVEFEAIGGVIHLNGAYIGPGSKASGNYPTSFQLGSVDIEVRRAGQPDGALPLEKLAIGGLALVAGIFAVSALGFISPLSIGASPSKLANIDTKAAGLTKSGKDRKPDNEVKTEAAKAAAAALRDHLDSLDLRGLAVTPETGVVKVAGVVDEGQRSSWSAIERWFDETQGMKVILQSEIVFASRKDAVAPITLQSIWAGKIPYLIDGKGDKYFEGSMLKDGWTVEKIEEGRVYIRRVNDVLILKI